MNRNLLLIAISLLTWGLGESMFINLHPLYLKELSAQPIMIGAIYSAMGFVMSLAHIPAGYLADRFGQRPLIWLAWIIGLAAAWVMALAPSLITFVIGLLIYSLTAFVMSPLNSYITAARGRLEVGRALTLISAFFSVGAIFGPFTGGWLATTFGLRQVYITAACIFLLSTVIIAFLRTAPNEPISIEERRDGSRFTRTFFVYLGIVFLVMFATALPQPLSPNYLQEIHDLTYTQIGWLGTITGIGIVFFNLILGRRDPRTGFLLSQACVCLFTFFLWRGSSYAWFIAGYFMLGGFRTARVLAIAQARNLVHLARIGLAYGLIETVGAIGISLAPLLAGILYQKNPNQMYLVSLCLILAAIIVSIFFTPHPPRSLPEKALVAN